jgi:hypothetical protein
MCLFDTELVQGSPETLQEITDVRMPGD